MDLDLLLTSDYLYPDNQPGKFINHIPYQIDLDKKKVKVCLKSISYNNSYYVELFEISINYYTENQYKFDDNFTSSINSEIYKNVSKFTNNLYRYRFLLDITLKEMKEADIELNNFIEASQIIFNKLELEFCSSDYMSLNGSQYFIERLGSLSFPRFFNLKLKLPQFIVFQQKIEQLITKYKIDLLFMQEKIVEKNKKNYFHTEKICLKVKSYDRDYMNKIENMFLNNQFLVLKKDPLISQNKILSLKKDEFRSDNKFVINFEIKTIFPKNFFMKNDILLIKIDNKSKFLIDYFYIFTNIINNDLCPFIQEPLFKLLKVSQNNDEIIEKVFHRPNFITINKSVINKIEIIIKDKYNNFVKFERGPTICEIEIKEK